MPEKRRRPWWILALLLAALPIGSALAAIPPSQAVGWPDPGDRWKTLETPHFRINYTDDAEIWARHTAQVAEAIHTKLVPIIRWEPLAKTEMTLVDDRDFSNGWAQVTPFASTRLFISPPDSINELEPYDDWLYYLINHEYTHILHLDKRSGAPAFLQHIFGRFPLLFPATLQPRFMTEGLAVVAETDKERHVGRGQSSYYAMAMRMEVKRGLLALNQLTVPSTQPPYAPVYLYGDYLINYLDQRYGREHLQNYLELYSSNLIPFWLNPTAENIYGKDFPELWNDMRADARKRYQPELAAIHPVTGEAFGTLGRKTALQARNGYVYGIRADNKRPVLLQRWQDAHQPPETLAKLISPLFLDVDAQGRVLVTQLIDRHDQRTLADIYLWQKGKLERLTYRSRFREARWLPDGGMIGRRLGNGESELVRLNSRGQEQALLWTSKPGEVLGQFSVSPDGSHLVAMFKPAGQDWTLAQFELATLTWRPLLNLRGISGEPSYTPDGKAVVFSADFDGRYDIRKLDLDSKTLTTLTQVDGGAFEPTLAEDGTLYYQRFDTLGFTPHYLKQTLATPLAAAPAEPRPARDVPEVEVTRRGDYSAWRSITPRSWFPYVQTGPDRHILGVSTFGADALEIHNYTVSAGIDSLANAPVGAFDYEYGNRYHFGVSRTLVVYTNHEENQTQTLLGRDHVELNRFHMFDGWDDKLSLESALIWEQDRDIFRREGSAQIDPDVRSSLAGIGLHFDNSESYAQSISPAWGRDVHIGVATHNWFRNDYTGQIYGLDWKEFIGFGSNNNVLALRALALVGDNARSQPILLGGEDNNPVPDREFFIKSQYTLRGYRGGAVAGTRAGLATAEWRFPIARPNKGWNIYPLGITDITGTLFTEVGTVWGTQDFNGTALPSVGAEATTDIILGYQLPLDVRVGIARGLQKELGDTRVYMELGANF